MKTLQDLDMDLARRYGPFASYTTAAPDVQAEW